MRRTNQRWYGQEGHLKRGNRGFTLIEVIVAAVLMGVGIAACLTTLGALESGEGKQEKSVLLHQLAQSRFESVKATIDLTQGGSSGDFSNWNLPQYTWTASVNSTGTTNLDQLDVTVQNSSDSTQSLTITGLVYVPSQTGTTATNNGTAGGSTTGGSASGPSGGGGG